MGGSSSKKQVEHYLATQGHVKHWGSVHTCSFGVWAKHQAAVWGFEPCINYSTRQEARLQPWATRGRHFVAQIPAPETQDIDMSASRMYATMAIEEKRNKYQVQCVDLPTSYFKDGVHFVEVVGYRDKHAIVQVATKHQRMDFLLVNLEQDTVRVVHKEQCSTKPYLFECAMSPDFSRILLKPNHYYAHFHNVQSIRDVLQCVVTDSKKSNPTGNGASIEQEEVNNGNGNGNFELHENEALRMAMTFDPRYRHSRVVLANVVEQEKPIIFMYDLKTRRRVFQNDLYTNTDHTAQQLTFSPGGNFIAVPLIVGDYQTTPPFVMADVKVFSANTLDCVYTLPPRGTPGGYVNLVPGTIFPMFSTSGAFLALPVSKPQPDAYRRGLCRVGAVSIHKVAPLMHLQSMCRTKIRQCVKKQHIPLLPLPEALKRFLLFMPFLE